MDVAAAIQGSDHSVLRELYQRGLVYYRAGEYRQLQDLRDDLDEFIVATFEALNEHGLPTTDAGLRNFGNRDD